MSELKSTQIDQIKVEELTKRWQRALPKNMGNIFSYESKEGTIQRIDKYGLAKKFILDIIKMNKGEEQNINTISILMGIGELDLENEIEDPGPDKHIFQPILAINFCNSKKAYYFTLKPILEPTIQAMFFEVDKKEDLNPRIAELFMLNWQSLTDNALMNAFEGLTGDNINFNKSGLEHAEITFGRQKLRRVTKYVYTPKETQAILADLEDSTALFLHLGSGLEVPDFHPFSFRPIIEIERETIEESAAGGGNGGSNYYDTSRPCPPFCGGNG